MQSQLHAAFWRQAQKEVKYDESIVTGTKAL